MKVPSYHAVVKPLLFKGEGDPSELMRRYPNFDANGVASDAFIWPYLHRACLCADYFVIIGLLRCGADIMKKDIEGNRPLYFICSGDEKDRSVLVKFMLTYKRVRKSINWMNEMGETALYTAAASNNPTIVCILIRHGADYTLCTNSGVIPEEIAFELEHNDVLAVFQKIRKGLSHLDEWRPWNHKKYPKRYRKTMRTVAILAKSAVQE